MQRLIEGVEKSLEVITNGWINLDLNCM
jgi:hypothetical protein